MISCASFWTYDGSPPRNIPCDPDSGLLKMLSLPLSPCHVLNCGYCFIRYVGMNQPMCPMTPFEPRFDERPALDVLLVDLELDVVPVLEDDVDLAVGHRLEERRALRELLDVDGAPEVLLEDVLEDVHVRRRTGPRVLVHRHRAAFRRARCARTRSPRPRARHDDQRERGEREAHRSCSPVRHPTSFVLRLRRSTATPPRAAHRL